MKPNPTVTSPAPCRATGQGEKGCPVCQAWGAVSGPEPGLGWGSGSRAGLGAGPGPSALPGSGQGPGAVGAVLGSGPALRSKSGAALSAGLEAGWGPRPGATEAGSEPGLAAVSEAVSGPAAGPPAGPGSGAGSGAWPGPKSGDGIGSEAGIGSGLGPRAELGTGLGPQAEAGTGAGSRPGSEFGTEAGSGAGTGTGLRPWTGVGTRTGLGPWLRVGTETGSGPGSGAGTGPRLGLWSGAGSAAAPSPQSGPKPSESVESTAPVPTQKTQASATQGRRQQVLVTGGGGYLGFSLGSSLAKSGSSVVLLDLRRPQWEVPPGIQFIQADVRDEGALFRAFEGVDCVFHVASYGMSGAEKLQKEQIESINVGGTKVVINVCIRRRVQRLIYTSTVNVAFGGKPIEEGDEDTVPYLPLDKHMDHYSRTKAIADQLTLLANGTPLPGGGCLRTCVLRPPGIYGPEEQRHLPRVASHIRKRLLMFRFGDRRTRMNWVHVQNLVRAHVLAAEALTASKGYVASGQAYYINDGESVNVFEWMAPLFDKLGYSQPWIQIPTAWVYLTATVMEYLHLALRPLCNIPPLLTRSEVHSVAVTHTFRIAKARAQLGYAPDKFSFADAVERYVQSTAPQTRGCTARALLRLLLGLLLLLGLMSLGLHFLSLQPL